jgi:hypothetical protein
VRRGLRFFGWLALAALGALILWQGAAEIIEPYYLLYLRSGPEPVEAATAGGTVLRLYADTRPHVGKITGLQKGLVWVQGGQLLVEEGYGFGCPILEVNGQAYVSRHAEVEVSSRGEATRLSKRYTMDTIDTPIRFLRRKYRPVPSLGVVTFHYDIRPDGIIDVGVDFSGVKAEWSRAYLMNEQGARRFTHYWDTNGTRLEAVEIGIWEPAETPPSRACFASNASGSADGSPLRFCVEPGEPTTVYYGRERYNQYNWRGIYTLSWSGIDLEVEGPRQNYAYRIVLEAG